MYITALNAHDNLALQRLTQNNGADVPVSFFGNPQELKLDYWRSRIPENIRTELAKLGLEHTLLDYLKGPNEVVCAMAKWGRAHMVYVAQNEPTPAQKERLERIANNLPKFTYYILGAKIQCITMRRMQFGSAGEVSTQTKQIIMYSRNSDKVAPFMQKESEHAGELDRLIGEVKHDLENVEKELKGCQEQYAKYKKIDEALQTDCAQLKSNMKGGAGITVTIRKMKEDMQKLINDLPNITTAQAKLKRHRLKALKEMETSWEQFANLHVDLINQL